jgi:hypothetical protein
MNKDKYTYYDHVQLFLIYDIVDELMMLKENNKFDLNEILIHLVLGDMSEN